MQRTLIVISKTRLDYIVPFKSHDAATTRSASDCHAQLHAGLPVGKTPMCSG